MSGDGQIEMADLRESRKRWWSDIPVAARWLLLAFGALFIVGMLQVAAYMPCPLFGFGNCEYDVEFQRGLVK